ncbi:MAG TPA: AAA family ATPase [Pyrinomonadaceae bacterium]|nr:AAA family ATPase [Pyrinomonadaceae bacterium]
MGMRLSSLELNGFRGFSRKQFFDFDADAVILVAANGHGKTSIFDSVLWALTGRIPRLGEDDSRFVSLYSETGQARVELKLKESTTGESCTITRSYDGKQTRITARIADNLYHGPVAEAYLLSQIWPSAATAANAQDALAAVLTRSVYLQQDVIREFVEAASEVERFETLSELVGTGRITELQASLERAKKAWSTATNQRMEELKPVRERRALVDARISELTRRSSAATVAITDSTWQEWWEEVGRLGIETKRVEPSSREASFSIDAVINELTSRRRRSERRVQDLRSLYAESKRISDEPVPSLIELRKSTEAMLTRREKLKQDIAREQARLSDLRSQQAAVKEKGEQLKTLAVLALDNLGEVCPVCHQAYDQESTRERLTHLANQPFDIPVDKEPERLQQLLAEMSKTEQQLQQAETAVRSAERQVAEQEKMRELIGTQLKELAIDDYTDQTIQQALAQTEVRITEMSELQRRGESLATGLAQSSMLATLDEVRREAATLREEDEIGEKVIASRNRTGDLAQRVIEALREASLAVVERRLEGITPILQNVYSRIDPHPTFRLVRFTSRIYNKRGLLSTVINDPIESKECDAPAAVLSSSQINALAVSVFLSLNIGVGNLPVSVAMLDDPLQSLDDINLLGLVELLRRTKDQRQLIVSTHDERFGNLLSRKLRPVDKTTRTTVIELDGWSREGPRVSQRNVECDPVRLRLIAS